MKDRLTLPVQISLVALVFYLFTLHWSVTLTSSLLTAQIEGWYPNPLTGQPLTWLLTLPIHLLPAGWIAAALNILSALIAASILGLLARTVQILPWDCPPDPKKVWALRLPLLFAGAVCGLEFNFWSNATAMSGELVGLLPLAIAIWCLLEFRAGKNSRWLTAAAIAWGLGLAENWAMILLLPAFLVALAAFTGWKKLKRPFFFQIFLICLTALALFSIQPLINGWFAPGAKSAVAEWMISARTLKFILSQQYFQFAAYPRSLKLAVALYFSLPFIAILLRIKNEAVNHLGEVEKFQVNIFRGLRLVLLLVSLWLMLDPEVGLRKILLSESKTFMPLLTLDYFISLSASFLLGSLLYAAQVPPKQRPLTTVQKLKSWVRRRAFGLLTTLAILVVMALGLRSGAGIWYEHQASLARCGEIIVKSLPAEGGVLLIDNYVLQDVIQARLAIDFHPQRWQLVDVNQYLNGDYRAGLNRQAPWGWSALGTNLLSEQETVQLLRAVAKNHRLFFLQPEPGRLLFEQYYPLASGAVQELKDMPEIFFNPPPLTAQQLEVNQQFWDKAWSEQLETLSRLGPAAENFFHRHLAVAPVAADQAKVVAEFFSILMNNWGVDLQRAGKFTEAKRRFEQAQQLNPHNLAALVNLLSNTNLRSGTKGSLAHAADLAEEFGQPQKLVQLMKMSGTFDEPAYCLLLGESFSHVGLPRQALLQLDRARQLLPTREGFTPELEMTRIYSENAMGKEVSDHLKHLRSVAADLPDAEQQEVELSLLEAKAWFDQTNLAEAGRVLESILQKNPDDFFVWEKVASSYLNFRSPTNALAVLDRILAKSPDDIHALNNKSVVLLHLGRADEAVPILNHILALNNAPDFRLTRAMALQQSTNLVEAEAAFLELKTNFPNQFSVNLGLAQIAEQWRKTNEASGYYAICLTNCPPGSADWRAIQARLAALKPAGNLR